MLRAISHESGDFHAGRDHGESSALNDLVHVHDTDQFIAGEDWTGVALALSTASPQLGSEIPTLASYWIAERRPPPVFYTQTAQMATEGRSGFPGGPHPTGVVMASGALPRFRTAEALPDDDDNDYEEEGSGSAAAAPRFLAQVVATNSDGTVSTGFAIEGASSIPSDIDDANTK